MPKIISDEEMAKLEAASSSPKIISDDEMNEMEKAAKPSRSMAALEGFGQGVGMGYLPQLQALSEPVMTRALDAVTGNNVSEDLPDYLTRRDENLKRIERYQKEVPGSYYAGQVGGLIAAAPAVAKGLAKVPFLQTGAQAPKLGFLGRTAQAAGGGAVMGAVQNPGDRIGVIDPLQTEERIQNAKTGAIVGGATQVGTEAIKKGADLILSIPGRMQDYARLKAFKSSGAMLKDFRKGAERGRINEMGQEMIEKGIVKAGSTFEDVASTSENLRQSAGQVIRDTYDEAAKILGDQKFVLGLKPAQRTLIKKTNLNAIKFAKELETQFEAELRGKAGGTAALSALRENLEELRSLGKLSNLADVQAFKESLDDIIKYNRSLGDEPLKKQFLFKMRDFLKGKIQERIDALDQVIGSNRLESLKEANRQYGIWAEISRIAKDRVARENANRFASLTDTIAGVGGAGVGAVAGAASRGDLEGTLKGAAYGAGLGLINKGARLYGNPILTQATYKTGGLLKAIPSPVTGTVSRTAGLLASQPPTLGGAAAQLVLGGKVMPTPQGLLGEPPADQRLLQRPSSDPNRKPARKGK